MKNLTIDNLTRVNNDVNGNPRFVVHFLAFLPEDKTCQDFGGISECYKLVCKKANKIGGRKYNTKSFGGGVVFQSYNEQNLINLILENSL